MKQYQNLDPVIRQLKSWHKYKTKPVKADTTILGNKTHLRYFRKFNNTTINENTDLLEYQLNDSTVPCLPSSMILIAFNISHTQNSVFRENIFKFYTKFLFPKCTNLDKITMQGLHSMSVKLTLSKSKKNSTKTRL